MRSVSSCSLHELFPHDVLFQRWKGMVLLEQIHHGVEVGHVLANHESEMTSMDLLVMDNIVANLVPGPLGIGGVGQDVLDTCEDSDGDSVDVLERDQVCRPLLVGVDQICVVVREDLESILLQVLRVVQNGLNTGTIWLVTHVNSKSCIVIKFGVLVNEELSNQFAGCWDI